jgi:hypothetical protein
VGDRALSAIWGADVIKTGSLDDVVGADRASRPVGHARGAVLWARHVVSGMVMVLIAAATVVGAAQPAAAASPTSAARWTQRFPSVSPSARAYTSTAYDSDRKRVVVVGGLSVPGTVAETWEWDGRNWTQRHPVTSPPARIGASMAYDAATHRMVLFGGFSPDNVVLSDTWEWNGTNWTELHPATSPPARHYAAVAYDANRREVVVFGGDGGGSPSVLLNDTWVWNGRNWAPRTSATAPSPRSLAAMTFDAATGRIVLFGGYNGESGFGDTWEWSGHVWRERSPVHSPSPRYQHSMVYDANLRMVVVFGGDDNPPVVTLGDTWVWNGRDWARLSTPISPGPRGQASAAYDQARHQLVLFGGDADAGADLGDTWTLSLMHGPDGHGRHHECDQHRGHRRR